jgi:hypothetical protein
MKTANANLMQRCAGTLLIATVLALGTACAKRSPTEGRTPVPIVTPAPNATGMTASGSTAVPPAEHGAITEAQVRSYVLTHRVPHALSATNVAVRSITFMPARQVSAVLHSSKLSVPDEQPMCLVIMTGTFVFPAPRGVARPTFPIGIEVFDARTGNVLQSGGLPRPPRPRAGG